MPPDFTVRLVRLEVMSAEQLAALEELVRLCRQDGVEGEIVYRPPATITPPPWWENTLLYMDEAMPDTAGEARVQEVVDILARRASEWAESRLEQAETARPQSILILDPTGLPVRKIQVDGSPVGEAPSDNGR